MLKYLKCFNPRTYIRYDFTFKSATNCGQSFNPRTYIRYDDVCMGIQSWDVCFNPRTYIRYDFYRNELFHLNGFQSTYLYKVRQEKAFYELNQEKFQSTYLYKVRQKGAIPEFKDYGFNPRTYIRYDSCTS